MTTRRIWAYENVKISNHIGRCETAVSEEMLKINKPLLKIL